MTGALVLVGTPIGNLGDLSPRASEALASADLVCCEDTRRTGKLFSLLGIDAPPLRRLDDHTEFEASDEIVAAVASGARGAVVSDAGMPGISDPGERLAAAVAAAGHEVTVVPGPSAAVTALVASGLPAGRFVFEGFLPRRGADRADRLAAVAAEARTVVLYESPHRLAATIDDLAAVCGADRRAAVGRELTKLHEEFVRGTLAELADWAGGPVKGEVVLVMEGAPPTPAADDDTIVAALDVELAGCSSRRDAVQAVAGALGVGRKRVYALALEADIPGGVTPPP